MPEPLDRLRLVGAQAPAVLGQLDRVRLAVHVAGEVLGGPAELEQHLLDLAALRGVHDHGVRVDPVADQRHDLLGAQHLLQHRAVGGGQHQAVGRVLGQPQPPVPGHRVGHVDQQRVRHRVAGVGHQGVDDLLGVMARGTRVPQPERCHPVRVHVLRRPLQFGERRDGPPALGGPGVVDLQEESFVALDDERSVVHAGKPSTG